MLYLQLQVFLMIHAHGHTVTVTNINRLIKRQTVCFSFISTIQFASYAFLSKSYYLIFVKMDDEWWQSNLRDLQSKPKRLETLTNMYTKINKVSAVSRHIVESILCAPALYDCLVIEGADKEPLVNLATDFIRLCLDLINLDPNDAKLPQLLAQALSHPNALLRALVLNELRREMVRQSDAPPLPNSELLIYVLDELQRPETLCSGAAVDILTLKITPWLTDPAIQTKLMQLLQQNEVIRCRAYELGVTLAKLNSASLSLVEFILDAALSELDNDDVLLQASVMEILVPLAEQNHGLSYMERRRVFEIISDRVHRMENNPLDTLLIPSIMKFFGKIAAIQPHKIIVGYPQMMACLFELLQSGDETIMPTGMDTMANLASSVQGKMLMHVQFQPAMKQLLQKYSEYMRTLSSNVKIRLLNSLHVIYTLEAVPGNELK